MTLSLIKKSLLVISIGSLGSISALAVDFDQNVKPDVIFGSGNTNGSFTVDQANNVELGLRGKLRHNAAGAPENTFNSNGDGTYTFDAGVAPTQSSPTAVWSFEWSINSDFDGTMSRALNALTYSLDIDFDPSAATSFDSTFDPIDASNNPGGFWDHSLGNNTTGNGAGIESTTPGNYATNIGTYNVAQNSWKAHWFITTLDPTVDGTYDFRLSAFDGASQLASTNIQIIVGEGGSSVPDSGSTLAFLGLALTAVLGLRRFKR